MCPKINFKWSDRVELVELVNSLYIMNGPKMNGCEVIWEKLKFWKALPFLATFFFNIFGDRGAFLALLFLGHF